MVSDTDDYIHIAWGHHNDRLRYVESMYPGSLLLTEGFPMPSKNEQRVTYPELYKMPNGNIIFTIETEDLKQLLFGVYNS